MYISPALGEGRGGTSQIPVTVRCYNYRPSLSWGLPIVKAFWSLLVTRVIFTEPPGSSVVSQGSGRLLEVYCGGGGEILFVSQLLPPRPTGLDQGQQTTLRV